jgi:hypothetical protein
MALRLVDTRPAEAMVGGVNVAWLLLILTAGSICNRPFTTLRQEGRSGNLPDRGLSIPSTVFSWPVFVR